jgi:hypothetical protein
MGKLLATYQRFDSLEGIREAYSNAFAEKTNLVDPIDEALSGLEIDALSAVRNLLVHNGGIADDEYQKKCKYISGLPKLVEGGRLQLDGQMLRELIDPVVGRAISLLKAVDGWVKVN